MTAFVLDHYLVFKALHIIAIISWMAGLLYLPRLFIYHTRAANGSEMAETFKVMEQKLLRIIMNPAMIASWVLGLMLFASNTGLMASGWMHTKFTLVVLMSGYHMYLARLRKGFLRDQNKHSEKFYRILNEVPTLLMIVIVVLAVVKPF